MTKVLRINLLSLLLILNFTPSISLANEVVYQRLLERIGYQLGTSKEVAEKFVEEVDTMAITIQNNFEKVASHQTPKFEKDNLIQETIARFFVNRNAIVQTTSLTRQITKTEPVVDYLNRLSGMSRDYYNTVKVFFDKTYFSVGDIEEFYEYGQKKFEFSVAMWQIFIGCKDEGSECYSDATKKVFHIIFKYDSYIAAWNFKVKAITSELKHTLRLEDYKMLRCRWSPEDCEASSSSDF
jgi:hypothetical protein